MSSAAEYTLLLDAIVPLDRPRARCQEWDSQRWGRLLRAADWHRLSPILFCYLESRPDTPGAVRSALERAYMASAARSLLLSSALRAAVDGLSDAGVPAMPLKGAALVETVYPDRAQREMLDLDILVPADRLRDGEAALAELGYRALAPAAGTEGASAQLALDQHHDQALVGAEQMVAVELHRHIAIPGEGRRFEIDGFWERARTVSDGKHLLPSAEDLLLHVCLHFMRNRLGGSYDRLHTGGALGQVCDIARLVEYETLHWDGLIAAARSYGLHTRVFLGLFAASELGVAIPPEVLSELEPPRFDRALGRRLVALRVLRAGDHLPVRTLRWMFAPSREVLTRGWSADPTATLSLARAYLKRARTRAPLARSTLRRPWTFVQDRRLGGQIRALEERP
jgi:hypothetical protein